MVLNNKSKRFKPWQSSCRGGALLLKWRRPSCSPKQPSETGPAPCIAHVHRASSNRCRDEHANRVCSVIVTQLSLRGMLCVFTKFQSYTSLVYTSLAWDSYFPPLSEAGSGFRKRTDYSMLRSAWETPKIGQALRATCGPVPHNACCVLSGKPRPFSNKILKLKYDRLIKHSIRACVKKKKVLVHNFWN